MSTTDLLQPLATLLRESTKEAHKQTEESPGAKLLLSGRLLKEEYVRYLMMLWHVYSVIEEALDRHAAHPVLEPTYNPALLARAPALSADIAHLLDVPESRWRAHPIHVQLTIDMPTPLSRYVSRIRELADSPDPSPLVAHSYVRYLGDLSGGQTIRRNIGKAYHLDEDVGLGLSFYAFKELHSTKQASQGEMKRIKDWFRGGLNVAGTRRPDAKASIADEASEAFILNMGIFSALNPDAVIEESAELPIVIEQPSEEKAYPLSQVISVIAAVCLAHFILVIGGFTGDRGYQKLLAIEHWFNAAGN